MADKKEITTGILTFTVLQLLRDGKRLQCCCNASPEAFLKDYHLEYSLGHDSHNLPSLTVLTFKWLTPKRIKLLNGARNFSFKTN